MSAVTEVMDFLRAPGPSLPAGRPQARAGNLPASTLAVSPGSKVSAANPALFRHWAAHSEWVRAAIDLRKNQVARAEWHVVPVDPEKPWSQPLADRIEALIRHPNPKDKIYDTFIDRVVEDFLVLDAGCYELVPNVRGEVAELWPVDAAKVRINPAWDGTEDGVWRYGWYPDGQRRATWRDDQFVYMMETPTTHVEVGLSKLEVLKAAIDSELGTSSYNDRQMRSAAPDGMLSLGENARPNQIEQFKQFWLSEVAGRGALAIVGGSKNPTWLPFRANNRDMQFAEWQLYLVRKICAVFGCNIMDLGFHGDVNRANAVVQQQNTEDRGLRPLLGDVSGAFTSNVVQHPAFGGPANNLMFGFTQLNIKESEQTARINSQALGGVPWKFLDEARRGDGLPPIGGILGRSIIIKTSDGALILAEDTPTIGEKQDADRQADKEAAQAKPPAPSAPPKGLRVIPVSSILEPV